MCASPVTIVIKKLIAPSRFFRTRSARALGRLGVADGQVATALQRLYESEAQDAPRQAAMHAVNPKYVLRNWLAEVAIRKAQERDFSEVEALLACLRQPYAEQPEFAAYAALPPDWANGLSVSCSS